MKPRVVDPVAHSVHDRLLAQASSRRQDFNAVLSRYGIERLLYRLTSTPHSKRFVLKGAAMFILWLGRVHRPTRDLDLLGSGEINPDVLRSIFTDVANVAVAPDGLSFDPASITVTEIPAGQEYQGLRVKVYGSLGTAKLSVQIDVGLGDAVIPRAKLADFPTLLDMPAPRMRVYPRETTIAEKLDAIIELGLQNTRMKEYYDIHTLSHHFSFDGKTLSDAIRATLARRKRVIPTDLPVGLSDEFAGTSAKGKQWAAFFCGINDRRKNRWI